jgi:hypothetical protein
MNVSRELIDGIKESVPTAEAEERMLSYLFGYSEQIEEQVKEALHTINQLGEFGRSVRDPQKMAQFIQNRCEISGSNTISGQSCARQPDGEITCTFNLQPIRKLVAKPKAAIIPPWIEISSTLSYLGTLGLIGLSITSCIICILGRKKYYQLTSLIHGMDNMEEKPLNPQGRKSNREKVEMAQLPPQNDLMNIPFILAPVQTGYHPTGTAVHQAMSPTLKNIL